MANKDFKVKNGIDLATPLPLTEGGTGQTTATNALNALLPLQTSANGQYLKSDGTNASWANVSSVSSSGGSTITVDSGATVPLTIQNNGSGNSFVVNDVSSDTTPFVIDALGNVGIGVAPSYQIDVSGLVLGTSATNQALIQRLNVYATGNNVFQKTYLYRHTDGSDWTGTSIRNQAVVDATPMAYIEYNPLGFSQGIGLGTGGATRLAIDSSGNVTINSIAAGTTSTATIGAGYMGMPQNSQSASFTLAASDAGKHIYMTVTGQTVTIPANGTVSFPIGTTIVFINPVSVTTTIAINTDTLILAGTGTTGSRTLAPYGMATAVKITSTSWMISGNGLT